MKTLLTLLIFLGAVSAAGAQQILWDTSFTSLDWYVKLRCPDSATCYVTAVGNEIETSLYKSSDGGSSWKKVLNNKSTKGTIPLFIRGLSAPTRNFVILGTDSGGMYRSVDGGATWIQSQPAFTFIRNIAMFDDSFGVANRKPYARDTSERNRDTIMSTTDGGATWASFPIYYPEVEEFQYTLNIDDLVILNRTTCIGFIQNGGRRLIGKSYDLGRTWQFYDSVIITGKYIFGPNMSFVDSLNGWFAGNVRVDTAKPYPYYKNYLARTTDGGRTWKTLMYDSLRDGKSSSTIAFQDTLNGLMAGHFIYRTRDGGRTWALEEHSIKPLFGFQGVSLQYPKGSKGVIAGLIEGYILTYRGPAAVQPETGKSKSRLEGSVYPNPVGVEGSVTVQFRVAEAGVVKIRLSDSRGQRVLAESVRYCVEGINQVIVDMAGLQPGIYIVQVRAGCREFVQKIEKLH